MSINDVDSSYTTTLRHRRSRRWRLSFYLLASMALFYISASWAAAESTSEELGEISVGTVKLIVSQTRSDESAVISLGGGEVVSSEEVNSLAPERISVWLLLGEGRAATLKRYHLVGTRTGAGSYMWHHRFEFKKESGQVAVIVRLDSKFYVFVTQALK